MFYPHVDINDILIDKSKTDRAKSKVKVISEVRQLEGKTQAICVGVECKIDEKLWTTKQRKMTLERTFKKKVTGFHHDLTITYEPIICSGEYLSHKTILMTGSTGDVMAQHVYDAL